MFTHTTPCLLDAFEKKVYVAREGPCTIRIFSFLLFFIAIKIYEKTFF